jgi:hypothetical protein
MTLDTLTNADWDELVERLGGSERLEEGARKTKAFVRPREIASAVDLLRMILAYCLGDQGLRLTAAWATSVGLADISNVALLYRLRQSGAWLASLVGQALASAAPQASHGRLIRIVDGTAVPKPGAAARKKNQLWRIHSAFDLPGERFGHFELTDQAVGEPPAVHQRSAPNRPKAAQTPPRAAATKAIPEYGWTILAPMGLRRDERVVCPYSCSA